MSDETLSDKLKRLAEIKKSERRTKIEYDALVSTRAQLEQECYDQMETEDGRAPSRKLDGIGYRPQRTIYANITDEDEFKEWALENDKALITEGPAEALLNQLVRTCLDNNRPLPPGVNYYARTKINMSGLKAQMEQEDTDD
jgi:hypothetical protein